MRPPSAFYLWYSGRMDYEKEFKEIISRLEPNEVPDPAVGISLSDINQTITALTEASMFLSRFVTRFLEDESTLFPDSLINTLDAVRALSIEISDVMIEDEGEGDCECEQCALEDEEYEEEEDD